MDSFNTLLALVLTKIYSKSFFAVVLVGTNPFLYGSALLAIVFAGFLAILLTATLFTFGQVFLGDPEFRLSSREAVRQAGHLLLAATGCAGVALFLGCICFLLLLSKGGNKVQSVSGVASFFMSHVVLTALPLLMRSLIRFIRNMHIFNAICNHYHFIVYLEFAHPHLLRSIWSHFVLCMPLLYLSSLHTVVPKVHKRYLSTLGITH